MFRRITLLATAAVLLTAATVNAGTQVITVSVSAFPATTSAPLGDFVQWNNESGVGHTVTGNSPLNLWNKNLPIGGSAKRLFTAAGTFPYHCNVHSFMKGAIVVRMTASPTTGSTTTVFAIQWATIAAKTGWTYEVQKRAPGTTAWTAYRKTTAPTGTFKSAKVGAWKFRARLVRTGNGATSGFSPVLGITIA
jgi:plastocyanin